VRNGVLQKVKEGRNILQTVRRRKANWTGHILCRNCLPKQAIEGKMEERLEVAETQGRRHKQLLDDLKEKTGYWKWKEEALDRTLFTRKRLWTSYKTDNRINEIMNE